MALLEGDEVAGFVVGRAVNRAPEEYADPLERQGTDGGVVGGAFGPVTIIEGARPERAGNGLGAPLDEGLAEEFGAGPAPVNPMLVAAALGEGRNAREHLQGSGVGEAFAAFAEGGRESRGEDGACTGEGGEELVVGERPTEARDLGVEGGDSLVIITCSALQIRSPRVHVPPQIFPALPRSPRKRNGTPIPALQLTGS
jgi:hypothetical protein